MIEEKAIVVSSNVQYAWIAPLESSKCSGCTSSSSCTTSFLSSILERKSQRTVRIDNLDNVTAGDHVIVGIHSVNLLWSSMLAYLLPVLCLIVFAGIGQFFFGELVSILLGLFGVFFGLFAANKTAANATVCAKLEPVMLGKTNEKVIEFRQDVSLLRL